MGILDTIKKMLGMGGGEETLTTEETQTPTETMETLSEQTSEESAEEEK